LDLFKSNERSENDFVRLNWKGHERMRSWCISNAVPAFA